jgi:O-antigen ligase
MAIIFFGVITVFSIITFKKPAIASGLILFLLPTYLIRFQFLSIPVTFLEILVLSFCFVGLIKIWLSRNFHNIFNDKNFNILVGLFLLAGIISTLFSPEKLKALGILKAFIIEPVIFFYACRGLIKKEDRKTILNFLFSSALIISLFGIVQSFTNLFLPLRFWGMGEEMLRITSVFEYPNALALYLAPILSFAFVMLIKKTEILNQKFLILFSIIGSWTIILTYSRGAWLGIILTFILLFYKKQYLKIGITILLIILVLSSFVAPVRTRLASTFVDASSSAHLSLMKAGIYKIFQSPILGNGLSGFRTTLEEQQFKGEVLNYPHNIFLNFWVELGMLGMLSFFALIMLAFKKFKQSPDTLKLAAVAFVSTLIIHGFVDVPYFKNDLSLLFWFMMSIFFI